MEKKIYNKPKVLMVRVDCDIVMQTQSDPVDPPTDNGCPDGEICFINPMKWFR